MAPPITRPSGDPEEGASFVRWVLARAGLNPDDYRLPPLLRRMPACLRGLRVATEQAARRLLVAEPELIPKALDCLLIGTTEFFRDAAVFDRIEHQILPDLITRASRPRVWSAACSEGAELYSVAMLLAKSNALEGSHLLGTDCRIEAIERAKRGVFAPLGGTLPAGLSGFWHPSGNGRIAAAGMLRQSLRWELADLLKPGLSGTWDLILCRNLAIYLEASGEDQLWSRLTDALAPGGYLVVGRAEKPRLPCLRLEAPSIYRKCTELLTPR